MKLINIKVKWVSCLVLVSPFIIFLLSARARGEIVRTAKQRSKRNRQQNTANSYATNGDAIINTLYEWNTCYKCYRSFSQVGNKLLQFIGRLQWPKCTHEKYENVPVRTTA